MLKTIGTIATGAGRFRTNYMKWICRSLIAFLCRSSPFLSSPLFVPHQTPYILVYDIQRMYFWKDAYTHPIFLTILHAILTWWGSITSAAQHGSVCHVNNVFEFDLDPPVDFQVPIHPGSTFLRTVSHRRKCIAVVGRESRPLLPEPENRAGCGPTPRIRNAHSDPDADGRLLSLTAPLIIRWKGWPTHTTITPKQAILTAPGKFAGSLFLIFISHLSSIYFGQ